MGQRSCILLFQHVLLFSELFKPAVFQGLTCCYTVIRIINHQFRNEVLDIGASVRYQLNETGPLNSWEIELHVGSVLLEVVEQYFIRGAQYVVNFMYLIHLIITRKQWEERNDFEKDTSETPHVHFITIIAIC